jgi:hypothetical protein
MVTVVPFPADWLLGAPLAGVLELHAARSRTRVARVAVTRRPVAE